MEYETREPRPSRTILSGLPIVILASVVLVLIGLGLLYQGCASQFWDARWIYPGSTVVNESASFLSIQQRILSTTDSPDVVEAWFREADARTRREAVTSGDFSGLANPPQGLVTAGENGGTLITYRQSCP